MNQCKRQPPHGEQTLGPRDYLSGVRPVWCAGCGDFGVLKAITKALAALGLPPERVALVAGIGCSSRIPAYLSVYGLHGVHGRALPAASGLAAVRPDITVLAASGDGDAFSIGAGHFLHACRRDPNLTCLVMDNAVYGMTKGQPSPTTESGWQASAMAPDGHDQDPLPPLELAVTAGAGFVARGFSGDPNGLAGLIEAGIRHPGFAFIQILSPCPTFRPEQMEYKKRVRSGFTETGKRREAAIQLLEDDGFTTGLLLREPRTPRPGDSSPASTGPEDIAAGFRIKRD